MLYFYLQSIADFYFNCSQRSFKTLVLIKKDNHAYIVAIFVKEPDTNVRFNHR